MKKPRPFSHSPIYFADRPASLRGTFARPASRLRRSQQQVARRSNALVFLFIVLLFVVGWLFTL